MIIRKRETAAGLSAYALAMQPHDLCTRCGYIGADVRPGWSPMTNKRHG